MQFMNEMDTKTNACKLSSSHGGDEVGAATKFGVPLPGTKSAQVVWAELLALAGMLAHKF